MEEYRKASGLKARWVVLLVAACLFALLFQWTNFLKRSGEREWPYFKGSDSNFYYAWGRSLFFDGDSDFSNDFGFVARHCVGGGAQAFFVDYLTPQNVTASGKVPNKYTAGPGLLALPALSLAWMLSIVASPGDFSSFSPIFPLAYIFNQVLAGFAGLLLSWLVLRRYYASNAAAGLIALGALTSALGYYLVFEPAMAHLPGFALGTLSTLCMLKCMYAIWEESGRLRHAVLYASGAGLALGLACCMRYTNIIFALVPPALILSAGTWRASRPKLLLVAGLSYCFAALLGILPQLAAWKSLYGQWFLYSYSGETLRFFPVHGLQILFGSKNSLFCWAPLTFFSLLGLFYGAWRGSALSRCGLLLFLATVWIYGGWEQYWLGGSFGMRAFIDISLFIFVGLAECVRFVESRRAIRAWRMAAGIVAAAAVLFSLLLMVGYRAGLQRTAKPLDPVRLLDFSALGEQAAEDFNFFEKLGRGRFPLLYPTEAETALRRSLEVCKARAAAARQQK